MMKKLLLGFVGAVVIAVICTIFYNEGKASVKVLNDEKIETVARERIDELAIIFESIINDEEDIYERLTPDQYKTFLTWYGLDQTVYFANHEGRLKIDVEFQ